MSYYLPLKVIAGCYSQFTSVVVFIALATTANAEICVFPQTFEACTGNDCLTDFADSSDSGVGANASVNLDERRALVRASGGAGIREANGTVGIRIRAETTTDIEISTRASFSGVIQGGILPSSFGRATVWAGIRNLTTGDVDEDVVFNQQENSANVTVLPQFPLQALTRDFSTTLEAGDDYVIYFRVRAQSRGATSNSDLRSGIRGVYFEALTLTPTTALPDADGDGLFNVWEDEGVRDCDNNMVLNLPMLGATSDHKDIFIEYDWTPGNAPVASSIAAVKAAFAAAPSDAGGVENPDGQDGIRLWIDTGNAATGDDFGGGQQIDLDDVPNGSSVPKFAGDFDENGTADFYDVKEDYFDPNRRFAFHYLINSGSGTTEQGAAPGSCSDGIDNDGDGLIDGDDIANCHRNSQAERPGNDIFLSVPGAGILMHELGHNLNLQHGGDVGTNCKPNYVSVMNYNMQNGIPQDTILGQDTNADGIADNRIVDYAPPRFPGGRGAPLPDINESNLDETIVLDPTDAENQTVFIDAMGATQTTSVDQPLDWAGDGSPPDSTGVNANINSGPSSGCSTSPPGEPTFQWHDDWSDIQMNFRLTADFDDAANNPTEEPEPTQEDLDALLEAIYTTDLGITKSIDPNPVAAGQPVTIGLAVENLGPNHTQEVEVRDLVPDGIEVVAVPEECELSPEGEVICLLGRLRQGETRRISLAARVRRDVSCQDDEQFTFISNTASVENLAGGDPNGQNNNSTVRLQVLCVNFEYPAKLICGRQPDPDVLRLMRGLYGTTVNIHNPNDQDTHFFKKLALAFPPAEQKPGRIIPLAIDRLAYDESLKTDCDEILRKHFPNGFPDGYVEGHLIVQSALSLDVQSVFTAAPLDREGKSTGVASIDVEYVPERDVAEEEGPRPDLAVFPFHPEPPEDEQFGIQLPEGVPESLFCGANGLAGGPARTVDAIVRNIGAGSATTSTLRMEFGSGGVAEVSVAALDPGAEVEISINIPRGCYNAGACTFTLAADADSEITEADETNNGAASLCLSPAG